MTNYLKFYVGVLCMMVGLIGGCITSDFSWIGIPTFVRDETIVTSQCKFLAKYDPHWEGISKEKAEKYSFILSSTKVREWANAHCVEGEKGYRFIPSGLTDEQMKTEAPVWRETYAKLAETPTPCLTVTNATVSSPATPWPDPTGMTDSQYEDAFLAILKKYGGD